MNRKLKGFIVPMTLFSVICRSSGNKKAVYPDLDVKIQNLVESVRFLTSIRPYRNYRSKQSLDKAAEYIESRLNRYGLSTEIQDFEARGEHYKNVIARYGKNKKEKIVVGAHYDVCEEQPGADDNASAVAGLLEIARLVRKNIPEASYEFEFVAYSLEEPPFFRTDRMGSYIHAESLHKKGERIRGMICLEMIGFFTDEEKSQEYPISIMKLLYPSVGDFIAVVGNFGSGSLVNEVTKHMKNTSVNVEKLKSPPLLPGVDFSDHRNYWHFDYKAVMITDTAFFRNPNYHKMSDTLETLNFVKMGEVVKGVTWALMNIK